MQIPLELDHATSFALEDFIVSASNQLAFDTIKSWPDWAYHVAALIGPEASGKSHLALSWAGMSGASIHKGAEIGSIVMDNKLKNLVIEDIDPDTLDEQALFHLINWSKEHQKFVLLTSRSEPNRWNVKLPDLKSRLSLIQISNIEEPDDQLLMVLLAKMFSDRQLTVNLSVINYIIPRMERSFSTARELVTAMDAKALSHQKGITQKIAKECLEDMKML